MPRWVRLFVVVVAAVPVYSATSCSRLVQLPAQRGGRLHHAVATEGRGTYDVN